MTSRPRARPRPLAPILLALGAGCTVMIGEEPATPPAVHGVPDGLPRAEAAPAARPAPPVPRTCAPRPARIWKLTPDQLVRTVAAILPGGTLPGGALRNTLVTVDGAFQNDAHPRDMSLPHVEQLFASATDLARQALAAPEKVAPCLKKRPFTSDCVQAAVSLFGGKAFRRPLAPLELDAYTRHYESEARSHGPDIGLRQALRAMFLSPHFLYRSELGDPASGGATVGLTSHERASALSYLIGDGPPDGPLLAAAERNELETPAQLEGQARRLLAAPATASGLLAFFAEHLALERVQAVSKDASKFPRWTGQVALDLAAETRAFIEHVLWQEDARWATLLTADRTLVNARIASVYGLPPVVGDALRLVTLPPGRVGLLSHGSFLAAVASSTQSDAIRRGRTVRERFLCLGTPEPPAELANVVIPPPVDGKTTARQRLTRHAADPVCGGCHQLMDPAGLALESFDAVGRLRTEEGGQIIDPSGTLLGLASGPAAFSDHTELAGILARAPESLDCLSGQFFAHGTGGRPADTDSCAVGDLRTKFRASGGDLRKLVLDLVTADGFVLRAR